MYSGCMKKEKIIFLLGSFFAGFALMVIELLAVRIMAPMVGASVFTWTSAIGTMLLGLSVGSYLGGIIADKCPQKNILAFSFLISSFFVAIIPVATYFSNDFLDAQNGIFILNLLLSTSIFFLPALFLGAIQPIIVKLYSRNLETLGKGYGLLSAFWSLGSILGVFLTGFYFMSHFGILFIVYGIASLLFVLGIVFFCQKQEHKARASLILFFAFTLGIIFSITWYRGILSSKKESPFFEKDSAYYHIKVIDAPFGRMGMSRFLFLDADMHSVEPKTSTENALYTDVYPVFGIMKKNIGSIHVIGGGAYTLPKLFARHYKDAKVSVSEIDKEVERTAERYFDLDTSLIRTDYNDPRYAFRTERASYDIIFGDAYNSFISVPWHLLTYEFNEQVKKRLNHDGIYAVNIVSATEGENSLLFKGVYKTFSKTFPNNTILSFSKNPSDPQNVTFIGSLSYEPINRDAVNRMLNNTFNKTATNARIVDTKNLQSKNDGVFLTDNFAPVENLTLPLIKNYFPSYFDFYKNVFGGKFLLSYRHAKE